MLLYKENVKVSNPQIQWKITNLGAKYHSQCRLGQRWVYQIDFRDSLTAVRGSGEGISVEYKYAPKTFQEV